MKEMLIQSAKEQELDSRTIKEVSAQQVLENFSQLFQNPLDKKKFIDAISSKKVDRWSLRHKGPYYRAVFAAQFKMVLDEMMQNKKTRIYRYKDFPEFTSHNTLKLKIYQSRAYLLDNLDSDGKYKLFCEAIIVRVIRDVGIVLELREDILEDNNSNTENSKAFAPSYLSEQNDGWKEKLEKYLMSEDEKGKFELRDIALSEDEQRELEIQLSQLSNVVFRVASDKIIVIKQ
jgi:hypothetical protein